jgi:hypothetical protein
MATIAGPILRCGLVLAGLASAGGTLGPAQPQYAARPPLAITPCGQSADAVTVSLQANRVHLEHVFDATLKPDRLRGIKTLVIVIGGSVKGLGGAALDEDGEMSRVGDLLAKARPLGVAVIAVHVGGESRRGAASDRLIDLVIGQADYLVVTEAGNRDGLFTRVSKARAVPIVILSRPEDVSRELKAVFSAH